MKPILLTIAFFSKMKLLSFEIKIHMAIFKYNSNFFQFCHLSNLPLRALAVFASPGPKIGPCTKYKEGELHEICIVMPLLAVLDTISRKCRK